MEKCEGKRHGEASFMGQHVTKAERERSGERVTQQSLLPVMPHSPGTQKVVFGKAGLPCQVNNVMNN